MRMLQLANDSLEQSKSEKTKERPNGKKQKQEERQTPAHIQIPAADQSVGGRSSKILEPPTRVSINLPYPPFSRRGSLVCIPGRD